MCLQNLTISCISISKIGSFALTPIYKGHFTMRWLHWSLWCWCSNSGDWWWWWIWLDWPLFACVLLRLGTRGLGGKTIIACFALFSICTFFWDSHLMIIIILVLMMMMLMLMMIIISVFDDDGGDDDDKDDDDKDVQGRSSPNSCDPVRLKCQTPTNRPFLQRFIQLASSSLSILSFHAGHHQMSWTKSYI